MSMTPVITALGLPADARVDRRVPKKVLLEQGVPTPADRRLLQDGIEELHWVAVLKPMTIGVAEFRDDGREYLEIAVVTVVLRGDRRVARVLELLHRSIPYPLVLVAEAQDGIRVSLAHKRMSEAEAGKVVVDEVRTTAPFDAHHPGPGETAFLRHLQLATIHARDLFDLYGAWLDRVDALAAAAITGVFRIAPTTSGATGTRPALDAFDRISRELAELRSQAEHEPQIARRVELNLAIQRLEAHRQELKSTLKGEEPS